MPEPRVELRTAICVQRSPASRRATRARALTVSGTVTLAQGEGELEANARRGIVRQRGHGGAQLGRGGQALIRQA